MQTILVKLKGGLGNQMFQYAFGKRLALQLNRRLVIDKSFLSEHVATPGITARDFELNIFHITEKIIDTKEVFGLGSDLPYRLNKLLHPFLKKLRGEVLVSDKVPLNLNQKSNKIVLDGYFQKEAYFSDYENDIRRIFTFERFSDKKNIALLDKISKSNSISIHVRRGDYMNKEQLEFHGICSVDYYQAALTKIADSVVDAHYFVFSDNPVWCKDHLKINGEVTFVTHNSGANNFKDMQLMSLCKHQIIANSSFSWWAAWLNPSENKIVIAPKQWYADKTIDTNGLYPKKWWLI